MFQKQKRKKKHMESLSFITQFKIEFLLPFTTVVEKCLEKYLNYISYKLFLHNSEWLIGVYSTPALRTTSKVPVSKTYGKAQEINFRGVLFLIKFQIYTYSFTEKNSLMYLASYEFSKTFQDGFFKRTYR